jgi:zinc protease
MRFSSLKPWQRRTGTVLAGSIILFSRVGTVAAAGSQEVPTAESVLERYIEVTGGKAAHQALHNEAATGTVEVVGMGLRGTIVARAAAPDKSYSSLDIAGAGIMEEGTNGGEAWERSSVQGPRIRSGEERTAALREAAFNSHLRWRELYAKVEFAGIEAIGERPCFKLVLTPAGEKPLTHYYDQETGLLVKISRIVVSPMGEMPSETLVSDYREVSGVKIPHSLKHRVLTQEIQVQLDQVRCNTELPANAFNLPDDVKALLEKKQE